MVVFASLVRFYGFSHTGLMNMPWVTFLGYLDTMNHAQVEADAWTRYPNRVMAQEYVENIERWRRNQPPPQG